MVMGYPVVNWYGTGHIHQNPNFIVLCVKFKILVLF
jgi:hypothetical protein